MNNSLTLGSLFDGVCGFSYAGKLNGITPLWASEIAPFPIRVATRRLPEMAQLGDITKLNGVRLPPVDILCSSSPCQNMSIAAGGNRTGLHGEQSSLFFESVRIAKEMMEATDGRYPRWFVWENVPGCYSSDGGRDFGVVLEEILKIKDPGVHVPLPENGRWSYAGSIVGDGYSLAWRTLDAQHHRTAQRRRRCYLVADFGSERAGFIQFESEGLCWDIAESRFPWERAARDAERSIDTAGGGHNCINTQGGTRIDISRDVVGTLLAGDHGHAPCVLGSAAGFCTEHSADSRGIGYQRECAPTLRAGVVPGTVMSVENHPKDGRVSVREDGTVQTLTKTIGTGGNSAPLAMTPTAYGICSKESNSMKSDNPHSGFYEAETSRTLDRSSCSPCCNQGGVAVVAFAQNERCEARDLGDRSGALAARPGMKQQTYVLQGNMIGRDDKNGPQGSGVNENVSFSLTSADNHAVAYCMTTGSFTDVRKDVSPTLQARDYKDPPAVARPRYIVRRLTPRECARLQGFDSDWCENLDEPNPTDGELAFWTRVWEQWRMATAPGKRPKTEKQIRRWLAHPYSDSEAYRAYGNGICLPCAASVLSGIVWLAEHEDAGNSASS